jgi:predicted aspartyl protease
MAAMETSRRTLWLITLLLLGACSQGSSYGSPEPDILIAAPEVMPMIPGALPVIEVTADGRTGLAMLVDSGASITSIDRGMAEELGFEIGRYDGTSSTTGADGRSMPLEYYTTLRRLELGSVVVEDFLVTVLDSEATSRHDWFGILGQDVLERLPVIVDGSRDELHLLPLETGEQGIVDYLTEQEVGDGAWAVAPIDFRPCPYLPCSIEGLGPDGIEILIDTGASSTSLPMVAIEALGLEPVGTYQSVTIAGISEGNTYQLEDFGLYGLLIDATIHGGKLDHGLMGMDILGELVVVFDGPGERIWLHNRQVDMSGGKSRPGEKVPFDDATGADGGVEGEGALPDSDG